MSNTETPTNHLFYVRADDDNGDNRDLFVVAPTQTAASTYWRTYAREQWGLDEDVMPEWVRIIPGVTPTRAEGPIGWDEINPD
jgi:hypothetical protein